MADGPIYEPPDRTAAPAPATRNTGDPAGGQPGGDPDDGDPYGYAPLPGGWSPPAGRNRPAGDPYGLPAASAPRIEPSQPPRRTRLLTGTLIGLVIGLLLFGTAGWFAGRVTAPAASPRPQSTRASTANGLGVFEQSQVALNKPDFNGTKLAPIAQGWLPYLSTCGRSGNPGGPRLANGEKTRVRCTLDGMSALFVEYKSTADRDRALARTRDQSADARKLTPGVARPTERATPSGRTSGSYVEFAYELTEGGVTRTVAGVWWDDAQTPIAAYLLAYWKDGLGERWEPVRDLWSRYA